MSRISERPSTFERWVEEENSWDQRHDDREYLPQFGAHRADEEAWRLARLARVYATARAIFLLVEQRPMPSTMIVSLHDHRGELTVTTVSQEWWRHVELIFRLAWQSENENVAKVVNAVSSN